jgi:glycosyltransferase involved in cell wall biosynthesis
LKARAEAAGIVWQAFLILDGDGQHDPAEVPRFLEAWEKSGADMVAGVRDYRAMPHPSLDAFFQLLARDLSSAAFDGERGEDGQISHAEPIHGPGLLNRPSQGWARCFTLRPLRPIR